MSGHGRRIALGAAALAIGGALVGCLAPGTPPGWSSYTIKVGAHSAGVARAGTAGPKANWIDPGGGVRSYQLTLTPTAEYVLTDPTDPADQFDWNKLPGFSDCGDFDLAQNGAMFGWRWRIDTDPMRLELVPYANNDGIHLYPATALVSLSSEDLAAKEPLHYSITIDGDTYQFAVDGTIRGREIHEVAQLPRACPTNPISTGKWFSGFYFGGTSVSPSEIYAYMLED